MKTSTVIIIALAAAAVIYAGNLGVAGNVLQYYIAQVNFTGISTGQIVLMVQNPSNSTIVLNSMAGTITANGSTLGNVSNFQGGLVIPANQQVPVTINVALSLSTLVSQLYDVLVSPTGMQPVDFAISGNANINGGIIVPFNITQTVNV